MHRAWAGSGALVHLVSTPPSMPRIEGLPQNVRPLSHKQLRRTLHIPVPYTPLRILQLAVASCSAFRVVMYTSSSPSGANMALAPSQLALGTRQVQMTGRDATCMLCVTGSARGVEGLSQEQACYHNLGPHIRKLFPFYVHATWFMYVCAPPRTHKLRKLMRLSRCACRTPIHRMQVHVPPAAAIVAAMGEAPAASSPLQPQRQLTMQRPALAVRRQA